MLDAHFSWIHRYLGSSKNLKDDEWLHIEKVSIATTLLVPLDRSNVEQV